MTAALTIRERLRALVDDFGQARRGLMQAPGFLAIAAIVLGLGLGATIFMFGFIDTTMQKPPPFPQAERLYKISGLDPARENAELDLHVLDYLEMRRAQHTFEDIAALYTGTMVISGRGLPERFDGGFVTPNLLSVLRAKPFLGRTFDESDGRSGAPVVVLLGHALWRTRFDADPAVIGSSIRVNGRVATIVGVMPEAFSFPGREQLWIPLAPDLGTLRRGDPNAIGVMGVGRLRDGVSAARAADDLAAITARLEKQYPQSNAGTTSDLVPVGVGIVGGRETQTAMYTMFAAVWLVLLIACANVASLIFVRANFRVYESAMRSALGARRVRLVTHVMAEAMIVALLGALIGIALAALGLYAMGRSVSMLLEGAPPWWQFGIDWRVTLFTVFATLIAGFLAGIVPALRASRPNVMSILRDGGRTGTGLRLGRFTTTMVIVEIALSAALLTGAALMTRSSMITLNRPIGANVEGFMSGRVMLPDSQYPPERRGEFFARALESLAARPGVKAAIAATAMPGVGVANNLYMLEGRDYRSRVDYSRGQDVQIGAGFFKGLGLALPEGREFDSRDRFDGLPVAIVNEAFVRKHFPGRSALGQRVRMNPEDGTSPWRTIVGVAPNVNHDLEWAPGGEHSPAVYAPLTQDAARFVTVAVRVDGDPHRYANTIREVARQLDPDLAVYFLRTIEEHQNVTRAGLRLMSMTFVVFAIIAVTLSAAGIYGVLSFNAGRRNRELGVRRALGARDRQILATVLRSAALQLALGLGLGALIAPFIGRLLEGPLLGLPPDDPAIYSMVVLMLVVIALLSSWIPAMRALRIDPAVALRHE